MNEVLLSMAEVVLNVIEVLLSTVEVESLSEDVCGVLVQVSDVNLQSMSHTQCEWGTAGCGASGSSQDLSVGTAETEAGVSAGSHWTTDQQSVAGWTLAREWPGNLLVDWLGDCWGQNGYD